MDPDTIARLDAVNRRFYERHAESFDAKRRRPWAGWERVLEHLRDFERPSILDVGCGNGRFGLYAARRMAAGIDYLGVDRSRALLELARRRGGPDWRWLEGELIGEGLPHELDGERFDLVACFGVMHHLPGESTRRHLLAAMQRTLAAGGLLAVSFWQLGEDARSAGRAVGVEALESLQPSAEAGGWGDVELAPRDYLLPWGESGAAEPAPLRYCHHVDRQEAERLVEGLDLAPVDVFRADGATGDLNLYYLLRRP